MRRPAWAGLAVITVAAGLASRAVALPAWEGGHLGDALYAVLIYTLVAFVAPAARAGRRSAVAVAVCFAVEVSQAWHPAWLDALRAHRAVALVLGRGFLWSDLLSYTIGVLVAVATERAIRR